MSRRFLSPSFLAAIPQRAAAGHQPTANAYTHFLSRAAAALNQPPLSIRHNGGSPYFRQDAVYIPGQDGVRNPASNMKSGELASTLSHTTLTLALAWHFTADTRYADKALELIHTWCINQNTLMFPTGRMEDAWTRGAEYGGDIILFARLQNLFLACYLLADYPGWSLPALAATKRWVRNMIDPQRDLMFFQGIDMYNNWEDARLLYLAKGALFLDDLDLLLAVFDRAQLILPRKMTDAGELPRETMRTRSMHYTLFALDSTLQLAEIAHQCVGGGGVDLYHLTINNRSLKKALDYAAHYLLHMNEWPHKMIEPLSPDDPHFALFELAHARYADPQYLQVVTTWTQPPARTSLNTLLYARAQT